VDAIPQSILEMAPPPKAVAARARSAFRDRFGDEPALVAIAPGRVNLIGEHTDYNGGFVLPMAIDRVTAVAVAPGTRAGRWRVHAADLGQDAELIVSSPLVPGAQGLWVGYIAGVAAGFQDMMEDPALPPLDLAIASSVPVGSGLSSSAAVEVAVATALEGILDAPLERLGKALLCQHAEHEFAGVPCGLMDQLASVMGRAGHALLIDCRSNEAAPIKLPRREQAVTLVIDSGVRHELAASEYAKRRAACESAAAKLGCAQLRDATGQDIARLGASMTDEERRCAGHVVLENGRVLEAVETLRSGDLPAFGRLMRASHASLRKEFRVSCPELDAIVDELSEMPGVFGARMTGAGFGGCAVALVAPGAVPSACAAVSDLARAAFVVQPSAGARLLKA
jgi:galactokinase